MAASEKSVGRLAVLKLPRIRKTTGVMTRMKTMRKTARGHMLN
jgi:hypothetical protein